jgi:IS4 transposase
MNTGKLIFSQLMDIISKYEFRKIVARHKGNHRVKSFTCWQHLLCLCFGQLTFRQSLRDLVATLDALGSKRYRMGIKGEVARSTLSDANAERPWLIYRDLAMLLVGQALQLKRQGQQINAIAENVYALDSTTIDLCLSLFPWAQFRNHKSAIKLHTLMDIEAAIPTFIHITSGRIHDVNILDIIPVAAGSIYIMDRGYLDFKRLYKLHQAGGRFVIRSRKKLQYYRKSSTPIERATGLKCDQSIRLTGPKSKQRYPQALRRVHFIDKQHQQDIVLLTNITDGDATQITDYYKSRWQIELFFKWIKQHLHIKAFYGRSINAVKTQIWTAICSYLIIVIAKNSNAFNVNLHTMMQVLSVAILERMPLKQLFSGQSLADINPHSRKQLGLFNF